MARHGRLTLFCTLLETMRVEVRRDHTRDDEAPLQALADKLDEAARLARALEFDPAVHERCPLSASDTQGKEPSHAAT